MKPKIIWSVYHSPFFSDGTDEEWGIIADKKLSQGIIKEENEYTYYEENQDKDKEIEFFKETVKQSKVIPVVHTSGGIIPIAGYCNITKTKKIFLLDLNFNLTKEVKEIICSSDGIESFEVISRYSARIGIGVCFSYEVVRQDVNQQLIDHVKVYYPDVAESTK